MPACTVDLPRFSLPYHCACFAVLNKKGTKPMVMQKQQHTSVDSGKKEKPVPLLQAMCIE